MQVVGIGASAGGIEAFRQFFEVMLPDTGVAFVIVLHMSAERKSMLAEIVARWTAMPVAEAQDRDLVEANHVYVIPPGHIGTLRKADCACGIWRPMSRARRRRSTSSSTAWPPT